MVTPFVLLPLYIYPSSTAWSDVYTQIEDNPDVTFDVVINVNSGPGSTAYNYPDSNWITGVSTLNGYSNTKLLGYVHTSWATRTYSDVTADIDAWASWASYSEEDIHMDGIFFDEAPSDDSSTYVTYMTNAATYARDELPNSENSSPVVVFNPGTTVSTDYYDVADYIVAYEDSYADYSSSSLTAVSSSVRAKSAFLVYSFTSNSATQTSMIEAIVNAGIPGIFITTESSYDDVSSYWSQFVTAVDNEVDGTTSSSSSSSSASSTKTSTTSTSTKATSTSTTSTKATTTSTSTKATTTAATSTLKTSTTAKTTTSTQAAATQASTNQNNAQKQGSSNAKLGTPTTQQASTKGHRSVRRRNFWGLIGVEA